MSENKKAEPGRYLCFSLAQEKFAIPLLSVKEVLGNLQFTKVPQSPPYFKGIVNLRGQIISVIDLRQKMKINSKLADGVEATTIILDLGALTLGVMVDSVDYVKEYSAEDLGEPPATDSSVNTDFILSVAREREDLVLVIDIKSLLNVSDYKALNDQKVKQAV